MRYCERLKFIREIFNKSQAEMGILFDVSQNTYCNYERGNREIPIEKLNIVSQFGIDLNWLLTGTINHDYQEYLKDCLILNTLSISTAAQKLNVPEKFITVIINGDISPSEEFYKKLLVAFDLPDSPQYAQRRYEEIEKIRIKQSAPDAEVLRLSTEIDQLREQLDTAYEELARQKGCIDAYREIIDKYMTKIPELINKSEKKVDDKDVSR